jgi:four helix bundle protein
MNIAEGSTGQSNPEFKRFLGYALRSDIEVVNCLHLAIRRGYIAEEIFQKHYQSCEEILIMISALIKSLN